MPNIELLDKKIKEAEISIDDIAKALSIDISTWYRKKKKPSKITVGDAEILTKLLCLTEGEVNSIFFS